MGSILAEEFKQKKYEQEFLDKVTQKLEESIALEKQGKKRKAIKRWLI